ncbi:MAG: hypothetical protein ACKPKO_31125, partial [Candidatus Fonsibacter sp.]
MEGTTVRVKLGGAGLDGTDLGALVRHLDGYTQRCLGRNQGQYALVVDLSCSWCITDDGFATHLVPYLDKWPVCRRIKLYKNAIG